MNQTVTANIAGIVFNIEDTAYKKLKTYLEDIKRHFKDEQEREEIMADIEARIAELFEAKLTDRKEVILEKEVDDMIARMGKPEDFAGEEEEEEVYTHERKSKRVYRDPDNKVVAGVASGISAYFGLDPIWLRLILVLVTIFGGIGPMLYIILWIVIPKAKTAAQKLEMKGEPVNVSNIGKTIKEDVRDFSKRPYARKAHDSMDRAADFIKQIVSGFFRIFGKFFGLVIFFGGLFLMFVLAVLLFGDKSIIIYPNGFGMYSFEGFRDALFESGDNLAMFYAAICLLIGIPALSMIYGGITILFNYRNRVKGIGLILAVFWLLGVGLSVVTGLQLAHDFQDRAEESEIISYPRQTDHIAVQLLPHDEFSDKLAPGDEPRNIMAIRVKGDSLHFARPQLNIIPTDADSIWVEVKRTALGSSRKVAYGRATAINYELIQQDSLLKVSPYFSTGTNQKIRAQGVNILVHVPVGKSVTLGKNTARVIHDIDNISHTYDGHMINKTWVMMEDGLTCLDCEDIEGITESELNAWKSEHDTLF